MSIDKALTVKEPWAWAITALGKDVENRSRRTKYRGPIYIHAGKAWDKEAPAFIRKVSGYFPVASFVHGQVIGSAVVVGCHHADDCWTGWEDKEGNVHEEHCSDWAMPGCYHWELANVVQLDEPFAAIGKLGLWNLSPKLSGD